MKKLVINRSLLCESLDLGGTFAGRNKSLSVLDNVKVVFRGDGIVVSSFDSDNASAKRCSCVSKDGFIDGDGFLVNPKDLSSVLKSFSDENAILEIQDAKCKIKHSRGVVSLPVFDLNDFPAIPKDDIRFRLTLPSSIIGTWVSTARSFHSNDALFPALQGFCMTFDGNDIMFAATDRFKLFADTYTNDSSIGIDEKVSIVVHNKVFNPLLSLLSLDEKVDITIGTTCVTFAVGDAKLNCRLIEGAYPNVKSIIPQTSVVDVEVPKSDLFDSVKRTLIVANGSSRQLVFNVSYDTMHISAVDMEMGREGKEECPCNVVKGDEIIEFSLKGDNLVSCLGAIDSNDVVFHLISKERAILMSDKERPSKIILTMPMVF